MDRADLHAYQENAVQFIKDNASCGLWLEMGLGKTVSTLTAIAEIKPKRVLIIAPLRVANTVWKQEATKWKHLRHLDIGVCTGSEAKRRETIAKNHHITVINRENIPWLVSSLKSWRWDMVVIDESSSFKSFKAKRFKALKAARKYIERCVLLSGTPSPNSLMDMWSQLWLIDQGQRLGKTISNYRNRFFRPAGYMGYQWELKEGAEDRIHAAIKDVCLSMSASDYLELPDRIPVEIPVEIGDKAMRSYKAFEKEFILELAEADIAAPSAATLLGKLLQCANGFAYDEDGKAHHLHSAKIDALRELVDDNPDENILVAYNFKADLAALREAFPHAKELDKSGEVLDDWNSGKVKMLLCHPASAGHGLNMQRGGALLVWYGLTWSLELYEQFNARLHRQGQTRPVRIAHLIATDTADEAVMKALGAKAKNQKKLLQFLKKEFDI